MTEHKSPKEKKQGKKLNLGRHKKTLVSGGLTAFIAFSGIFIGIILIPPPPVKEKIFIWGTGGMESIDPLDFRNRENFAILENIVESLFDYEFTAEGSNIIPRLAIGYNWSDDYLNFTCHLRQDVNFHDGMPFNATVVKWNIDRIFRLKDHIYWDIWLHPNGKFF